MKKMVLTIFIFSQLIATGQSGSEIFLFDLKVVNGQVFISGGKNITNHKGYDNQPFFDPTNPIIYYSSSDDSGRSDIRFFDYNRKQTVDFIVTKHKREYSPTVTPDGQSLSCIIQHENGAQDLALYPLLMNDKPVLLINDLKIGYHAWVDDDMVLLFVLGDNNTNSLHCYELMSKRDSVIAFNIGRSLHAIPGQTAMSFVQKSGDKEGMIKRFDLDTGGSISNIVATLPGQDHLTWLRNDILLMSDGSKLFSYQVGKDSVWQPVIVEGDNSMLRGVTRLATDVRNSRLAIVVSE